MLKRTIYTDNGAARGSRTRYFRDSAHGGVEWIFSVDYHGPAPRWLCFLPGDRRQSVAAHIESGAQWEAATNA
jgi:hypothetical protein